VEDPWHEIREALRCARPRPDGERRSGIAVDRVLPGRYLSPPPGSGYLVERRLSIHHYHGGRHLSDALGQAVGCLGVLAGAPGLEGNLLEELVFLDTETTGLDVGPGTLVILVGTGRFEAGGFVVRQFFLAEPAGERPLLEELARHLDGCAGLVTFNGRHFDLPQLESRFVLNRLPPAPSSLPNLDLLPVARRVWGLRLASRSLASLEDNVLGYMREGDVPGYLVPSLYREYLRTGDATTVAPVFEHNLRDILSMVMLVSRLVDWCARAASGDLPPEAHPADVAGLGRACEYAGLAAAGTACYEAALARGLDGAPRQLASERLARLYRRLGMRAEALAVWSGLVASGQACSPDPYIELAKHYEHVARDPVRACALVEEAIVRFGAGLSPAREAALRHRLARLRRRLDIRTGPSA